jgi:hypothetical protein
VSEANEHRTYPRRHPHLDPGTLAECLVIDAAYLSWLESRRQNGDDVLDDKVLRSAWRTAWVEGVIRERLRATLGPLPPAD